MPDISETMHQIGPLFYPLLALSLVGFGLILERIVFFLKLPNCKNSQSFNSLATELKDNAHLPKAVRDELLSFRLMHLKEKLEYGVNVLRIIAVLSPMLGLLGTVLGMIEAFKDISVQQGPVVPAMIADGLWSAMLTTAYGLSIALPCLLAAFVYTRLAERRVAAYQNMLNIQSLKIDGANIS